MWSHRNCKSEEANFRVPLVQEQDGVLTTVYPLRCETLVPGIASDEHSSKIVYDINRQDTRFLTRDLSLRSTAVIVRAMTSSGTRICRRAILYSIYCSSNKPRYSWPDCGSGDCFDNLDGPVFLGASSSLSCMSSSPISKTTSSA